MNLDAVTKIAAQSHGFLNTLLLASTAATRMPFAPKISAVDGMRNVLGSEGMWNCTSVKAPGHSLPSGLSACNSIRVVRLVFHLVIPGPGTDLTCRAARKKSAISC